MPSLPDKPDKPTLPERPEKPTLPERPTPELPDKPEKPTLPERPEKPTPELPDKPEKPTLPEKPAPDMPDKPSKPTQPEAKWDFKQEELGGIEVKQGVLDDKPEASIAVELKWEKDLLEGKQTSLKKLGGEDNYLKFGNVEAKLAKGYKLDLGKGEFEVTPLSLKGKVSGVEGQLQGETLSGLVGAKGTLEAFSAEGEFTPLSAIANKEGLEVKSGVGAEAALVKGSLEGKINITPKTIYDNTLGAAVGAVEGLFREPKLNKLPSSWDHGIIVGAKGEAGIAAAAKAEAALKVTGKEITASAEVKLGVGPMAGLKVFFGVK